MILITYFIGIILTGPGSEKITYGKARFRKQFRYSERELLIINLTSSILACKSKIKKNFWENIQLFLYNWHRITDSPLFLQNKCNTWTNQIPKLLLFKIWKSILYILSCIIVNGRFDIYSFLWCLSVCLCYLFYLKIDYQWFAPCTYQACNGCRSCSNCWNNFACYFLNLQAIYRFYVVHSGT